MGDWLVYALAGVGCAAGVLVTVGVLLHLLSADVRHWP